MRYFFWSVFITLILGLSAIDGNCHQRGSTYLYLNVLSDDLTGFLQINCNDLNQAFGYQLPQDFQEEDIQPYMEELHAYIKGNLRFTVEDSLEIPYEFTSFSILETVRLGNYAIFYMNFPNIEKVPKNMSAQYNLLFDEIPSLLGMILIAFDWYNGVIDNESEPSLIFNAQNTSQTLNIKSANASFAKGFFGMIMYGIKHIWKGIDHMLILIGLVLASIFYRRPETSKEINIGSNRFDFLNAWSSIDQPNKALLNLIIVVAIITISQVIALLLSSYNVVSISRSFCKLIIALSIGGFGLHILWPIFKKEEWVLGSIYGFFHGFDFAPLFTSKGIVDQMLTFSISGFSLGIGIGQLLAIAIAFLLLYRIREKRFTKILMYIISFFLFLFSLYSLLKYLGWDRPLKKALKGMLMQIK